MVSRMTEIVLLGDEDDVEEFVEQLREADGDLSRLIYNAAANDIALVGSAADWVSAEQFVSSPIKVNMDADLVVEPAGSLLSASISVRGERFMFAEALCLRTLFKLDTSAWFFDPVIGWRGPAKLSV